MAPARIAGLLSYRNVAAGLDLNHETVKEYVGLLQTIFLVRVLPAWRPGIGSREVQAPKCHVVDAGLLAHLLGADEARIAGDDQVTGRLLESFVVTEILKHVDWAVIGASAYHYRQRDDEVDLVLENRAGDIAAVEVKAAASLRAMDWRPLEKLRDGRGERFKAGVVIYTGAQRCRWATACGQCRSADCGADVAAPASSARTSLKTSSRTANRAHILDDRYSRERIGTARSSATATTVSSSPSVRMSV